MTNTDRAVATATKARRHKRTRNAACTPVPIPGPTYNRKRGYVPTVQRRIVRPEDRKGSEKAAEAMRVLARRAGMYVGEWPVVDGCEVRP